MLLGHTGRSLRPLLLVIAVIAVLLLRTHSAPAPIIAPSGVLGDQPMVGQFEAQSPLPSAVLSNAPDGTPVATTAHLRILTRAGSYAPAQAATLAEPLEAALSYVEARTSIQLKSPITVVFDRHPDACGLDGAAYTERRTIFLYACPSIPTRRAVNILAHEFVHQLAHDYYGDAHLQADLMLSEGFATWGAGQYWLGNQADFRRFVARNYGGGLLPLQTYYNNSPAPDAMNRLYYEWAAFVEWTLVTHGRDAFDQLYRNGNARTIGSAPYREVLGADMGDVEIQWQAWLKE